MQFSDKKPVITFIKSLIPFNISIFKLEMLLVLVGILYVISFENYLLFRIVISLFNVIIAYMVFIIVWKSKAISENRYLTFIGVAFFFIACLGFLRSFSYKEMGVFPEYGTNLPVQLWIIMRYLGGVSFFVAPLFLTQVQRYAKKDEKADDNDRFAKGVFTAFAIVTSVLLLSIFKYRYFPVCYIEGSGLTNFKIFSEYIISFLFIGSLLLLYRKRDRFERQVYRVLTAAIVVSIFAELALIYYTNTRELLNFTGQIFNALSFYLIYIAIVETGFEEPCNLLFRNLKFSEEVLRKETTFLKDDQGRIYRLLGVEKYIPENKLATGSLQDQKLQDNTTQCGSFAQSIHGLIHFRLNEYYIPVFIDGAVEEITGYSRQEFVSGRIKWAEIVVPEDRQLFVKEMRAMESNPNSSQELEYKIKNKNGEIRWIREIIQVIPGKPGNPEEFQGFIYDTTQRRVAEETLIRNEEIRIKEIHHRIKNNLQVISSLLSLQADELREMDTINPSNIFEAFRESQNRVVSMALIHEELYQGKGLETLEFSAYLRRLTAELHRSYATGVENIRLKLELEPVYLDMDTAVPLGIIVNELVSNSLKHAFPENKGGEIHISLFESENYFKGKRSEVLKSETKENKENETKILKTKNDGDIDKTFHKNEQDMQFTLIVADNGKGIPDDFDFMNMDSLGLQLVNLLVEQIDGCIELTRGAETEFKIKFKKPL